MSNLTPYPEYQEVGDILVVGTHHTFNDSLMVEELLDRVSDRDYLMIQGRKEERNFLEGADKVLINRIGPAYFLDEYHQEEFVKAMKAKGLSLNEIVFYEALSETTLGIIRTKLEMGKNTENFDDITIGDGKFDLVGENAFYFVQTVFMGPDSKKWQGIITPIDAWNSYKDTMLALSDEGYSEDLKHIFRSWMNFTNAVSSHEIYQPKVGRLFAEHGGKPVLSIGKMHFNGMVNYLQGKTFESPTWEHYLSNEASDLARRIKSV